MLSAISGSNTSQYSLQQARLEQAVRRADEADRSARSLQSQANDAQQVADAAAREARTLASRSSQAQAEADRARLALLTLRTSAGSGSGRFINVTA